MSTNFNSAQHVIMGDRSETEKMAVTDDLVTPNGSNSTVKTKLKYQSNDTAPYIVIIQSNEQKINNLHPISLGRRLYNKHEYNISSIKQRGKYKIEIQFLTYLEANSFLESDFDAVNNVVSYIPKNYIYKQCIIKGIPIDIEENEIQQNLKTDERMQDASYILCLDTLASSGTLYLHVSKPPREGSPGAQFFNEMKDTAEYLYSNKTVDSVHKKINLAEEVLAWEHERYSIRRLPAFTISSLKSHKDSIRASILDVRDNIDVTHVAENTQIIAEALARHIFNLSTGEVFSSNLGVEVDSVKSWLDFLTTYPRSAQLLADRNNALVNSLKDAMNRYLKEVKVTYQTPDKRDPEFVFYDVTRAVVNVYSVKPAVFDLFLTIAIAVYLGLVYLVIQNFTLVYSVMSYKKSKSQ